MVGKLLITVYSNDGYVQYSTDLCEELVFSISPPVAPDDYQLVSFSVKLLLKPLLCVCFVFSG